MKITAIQKLGAIRKKSLCFDEKGEKKIPKTRLRFQANIFQVSLTFGGIKESHFLLDFMLLSLLTVP